MDAKKFLEEWLRMCGNHKGPCESCLAVKYCQCYSPLSWDGALDGSMSIDDFMGKVEQWAKEHPAKTRLDDLEDKYPDTPMVNAYPPFAPRLVGYCGNIQTCAGCKQKRDSMHKQCWDMEVKNNGRKEIFRRGA